jgi:hypothetical protein
MHYLTITVHHNFVSFAVSVQDGVNGGLKVISSGSDPSHAKTWRLATLDVIGRLVDIYGGLVDIDIIHAD